MKVDFSKFSSVRIGGVFEVAVLDKIENFDGKIIGGANNILISPNPPKMGILGQNFDYIHLQNGLLRVGAKTSGAKLFRFAQKHDLGGFEFLGKIPGTIGGIVTMNAGLKKYEISNNLLFVTTNFGQIQKDECDFSYRHSNIGGIIFEAVFEIKDKFSAQIAEECDKMRQNQPRGASFGSCFKNPPGHFAGALIEGVGLKGERIGGCGFSDIHANFLINYGGGTFDEAIALINLAKERVFKQFGVCLESEVVIL